MPWKDQQIITKLNKSAKKVIEYPALGGYRWRWKDTEADTVERGGEEGHYLKVASV